MNFTTAVKTVISKTFNYQDRAPRSEYWYWMLFTFLLGILTGIVDGIMFDADSGLSPISNLASILTLLPGIAVAIRRLHDINRTGWWLLLVFTVIGSLLLLYWAAVKGTEGENRFGPDPLAS